MPIALREVAVPSFGVPLDPPPIPASVYEKRSREAYARAGCDWLVVYADREHHANIAFLSGYDPRFEEALLLLGPGDRRVLVVGNEGEAYAPLAGLPGLETALAQSMSLMGQDRSRTPDLAPVLRDAGLRSGQTIGLVGWKYFEAAEWDEPSPGLFVPHYLVVTLGGIAGGTEAVRDATSVLMHPATGLRSTIDADQIALHEWGSRARFSRGLAHCQGNAGRRQRIGGGERHGLRRRGSHRPCHARDGRRAERSRSAYVRLAGESSSAATARRLRSASGAVFPPAPG